MIINENKKSITLSALIILVKLKQQVINTIRIPFIDKFLLGVDVVIYIIKSMPSLAYNVAYKKFKFGIAVATMIAFFSYYTKIENENL